MKRFILLLTVITGLSGPAPAADNTPWLYLAPDGIWFLCEVAPQFFACSTPGPVEYMLYQARPSDWTIEGVLRSSGIVVILTGHGTTRGLDFGGELADWTIWAGQNAPAGTRGGR